jgi:hypothetical protein
VLAFALASGCQERAPGASCGGSGSSLPGADPLFRKDPSFLGGDAAYSADLGKDRVLWMFGDSFVKKSGSTSRRDAALVRNSVAIQTGRNPTSASLQYFWRGGGAPASFVPESGDLWYWPMGAAVGNGALFLFYSVEKAASGGLGFEPSGSQLFVVDDPSAPPLAWTLTKRTFPVPPGTWSLMAPLVLGDQLWVYAVHEPDHAVSVARVRVGDALLNDFSKTLWWCGDRGWRATAEVGASPASIFPASTKTDLPSELSVSQRPDGSFVAIHSVGFGATKIALRTAAKLEGPWSEACPVFEPPESRGADPFVYAAKGHAELAGGELLVTYVASARDDQKLFDDLSLYWPRFVNVGLAPVDAGVVDGDR